MRIAPSLVLSALLSGLMLIHGARADAAFQAWLQSLWPQAQGARRSRRTTFDLATNGPRARIYRSPTWYAARPAGTVRARQAGVRADAGGLPQLEGTIAGIAAHGRKLLDPIPRAAARDRTAVRRQPDGPAARSSGARPTTGAPATRLSAIRVLATQAYVRASARTCSGRNSCCALKILEEGTIKLADMRSSWGGAMGLHPVPAVRVLQIRGRSRRRWHAATSGIRCPTRSPPPPQQLVDKGWQRGMRWAYEVRAPRRCRLHHRRSRAHAADGRLAAARLRAGLRTATVERRSCAEPASLLQPEGTLRPGLPDDSENYFAIKEYNFSDLYVLLRRPPQRPHRRIRGRSRRRGARAAQLRDRAMSRRMQQHAHRARLSITTRSTARPA